MSEDLMEELKEFLGKLKLSNYEINAYIALLHSESLSAREIIKRSGVPRGRIYSVLEDLRIKGMVQIQDSRPKKYKAIPPNMAMNNLIAHIEEKSQNNILNLYNQAKFMEIKLQNLKSTRNFESPKIFWSTAYGINSIQSLYIRNVRELKEELLLTGFLNQNTKKILPLASKAHESIFKALKRGVKVYYLWSLEFLEKDLLKNNENKVKIILDEFREAFKEIFNLTPEIEGFELKFTVKKIPTYYDIFDGKTIIFKLQNPLNPWQIFASMKVLDPKLAENLRKLFFNLWQFESFEQFDDNLQKNLNF